MIDGLSNSLIVLKVFLVSFSSALSRKQNGRQRRLVVLDSLLVVTGVYICGSSSGSIARVYICGSSSGGIAHGYVGPETAPAGLPLVSSDGILGDFCFKASSTWFSVNWPGKLSSTNFVCAPFVLALKEYSKAFFRPKQRQSRTITTMAMMMSARSRKSPGTRNVTRIIDSSVGSDRSVNVSMYIVRTYNYNDVA